MKTKKKISWVRIFGVLLILFVLIMMTALYTVFSKYNASFTGTTKNCAVVFGAAVWKDDQPSHALYDRIVAGVDLYNNNQVSCLVFSGGASTYGSHEVDVMTQTAVKAGVPERSIVKDYRGINTLATMQNLREKSGYVFVSNDFHLGRISLIAKQQGFKNFYLHGAPYLKGRYLKETYFVSREIGGIILYTFFSWLM